MLNNLSNEVLQIYIIKENFFNGYIIYLLDFFYIFMLLTSVLVIINKNAILAILYLICLFLNAAGYFIVLGINFIGISYLLIYVGAVSVLFIFILMLISIRTSEKIETTNNSVALVGLVSLLFIFLLYFCSESHHNIIKNILWPNDLFIVNTNNLFYVTSNSWDSYLAEFTHINSIGNIMYANFSLLFIIACIILLLAMVGTICLVIN